MEREIIKGKARGLLKYPLILIIIGVLVELLGLWGEDTGNLADISIICYILGAVFFVAAIAFFFYGNNCEIIVTDKRVYGKASFGKRVDLPMDSISAVGIGMFNSISVASSSGKINFIAIDKKYEIHKEISSLLTNRQSGNTKVTAETIVQERSSAEELKKFKELLDSGVISQEEFEAKKKQLLGL